ALGIVVQALGLKYEELDIGDFHRGPRTGQVANCSVARVSRANIASILSMFSRGRRVPSSMSLSARMPARLASTVVNGSSLPNRSLFQTPYSCSSISEWYS